MLQATQEEVNEIREYFQGQAPDLEISFMQKVYSESVLGVRHDVWDIHTNKDRWWIITNPTNLYSQEQFPNMDLVVTFHIGLCIRIPRTQRQKVDDQRIIPFGPIFKELRAATDALSQALSVADYQAIGVRSREILLRFVEVAQDSSEWTDDPPKRADFRGWIEVICNSLLPSESNKERRKLLKTVLELAWTFSNWLTHAKSASWQDADFAIVSVDHAINMATPIVIRSLRNVPEGCPECGSPRLEPESGKNTATPELIWERPRCSDCGWTGKPVPITASEDLEELIIRDGEKSDDCAIMVNPLRSIRKL